jgi:hypothetical protein
MWSLSVRNGSPVRGKGFDCDDYDLGRADPS